MTTAKIQTYFDDLASWRQPVLRLRQLLVACDLKEEYKWRGACYTHHGRNVVSLGAVKAGATLGFFAGALLDDPDGLLVPPGPNSRAMRVLRCTSVEQVDVRQEAILRLIDAAKAVVDSGKKVDFEQDRHAELPEELLQRFGDNPALKAAFDALTPGRQRGYVLHFAGAKQAATRFGRIDKMTDRILSGHGIHDCVCGLSQKMPRCDGSHKHLKAS